MAYKLHYDHGDLNSRSGHGKDDIFWLLTGSTVNHFLYITIHIMTCQDRYTFLMCSSSFYQELITTPSWQLRRPLNVLEVPTLISKNSSRSHNYLNVLNVSKSRPYHDHITIESARARRIVKRFGTKMREGLKNSYWSSITIITINFTGRIQLYWGICCQSFLSKCFSRSQHSMDKSILIKSQSHIHDLAAWPYHGHFRSHYNHTKTLRRPSRQYHDQ